MLAKLAPDKYPKGNSEHIGDPIQNLCSSTKRGLKKFNYTAVY